ncbi:MAG: NAD(P)/FAD-dependent oxidoreductase [Chloroflexota bacterium]
MKYDLVIVGGGPAGLMAAKTAAEDGLKVLLIDKKSNLGEISRGCASIFYTCKMSSSYETESGVKEHLDAYIEPVSVECMPDLNKTRFHLWGPGFNVDYEGQLRPYLNWVQVSPSGHVVYRYKPDCWPWGFYFDKATFLGQLSKDVEKAGATVRTETTGIAAENVAGGVRVQVQSKSNTEVIEGRAVIAADGLESKIMESLGLEEKREVKTYYGATYMQYIVEGLESPYVPNSWVSFTVPSINPFTTLMIGMWKDGTNLVGATGTKDMPVTVILDKFMRDPRYAPMFHKVKVIRRMGTPPLQLKAPIKDCVVGNVVLAGDAGLGESWVQGAVAQGYKAAKAIVRELGGQPGYNEYVEWRQKAFATFAVPSFWSGQHRVAYHWIKHATDEDVDYVYGLFAGRIGYPAMMLARNVGIIKKDRPQLYEKLVSSGVMADGQKAS